MRKLKYFTILLLLSFKLSAQHDSINKIAVVSADKMNVVYRGISNPISIAVPNAKSFIAEGPGLSKFSEGEYILKPGQGLESVITIHAVLNDGSKIKEEHRFKIKGIKHPIGTLNGKNDYGCIVKITIEELKSAEIGIKIPDFYLDIDDIKVEGFSIVLPNKKNYYILGNRITDSIYRIIKKLKHNSRFTISDIYYDAKGVCGPRVTPIDIMIIKEEPHIPYYQSPQFVKDSLNNIRKKMRLLRKSKKKE